MDSWFLKTRLQCNLLICFVLLFGGYCCVPLQVCREKFVCCLLKNGGLIVAACWGGKLLFFWTLSRKSKKAAAVSCTVMVRASSG